jgi:hypothetical protein
MPASEERRERLAPLGEVEGHVSLVLAQKSAVFDRIRGGASPHPYARKGIVIWRDVASRRLRKGSHSPATTLTALCGVALVVGADKETGLLDGGGVRAKPVYQVTSRLNGNLISRAVHTELRMIA